MTNEPKLKPCTVNECNKTAKKNDILCSMHRARLTRTGRFTLRSPLDKLCSMVSVNAFLCLEFTGYKNERGYGRLRYKGKKMLAHRLMWLLKKGSIPKGMLVLHKCDNPSCCNIEHLFLGTHKDNYKDALQKDRINPSKRAKERWVKCPTWKKK